MLRAQTVYLACRWFTRFDVAERSCSLPRSAYDLFNKLGWNWTQHRDQYEPIGGPLVVYGSILRSSVGCVDSARIQNMTRHNNAPFPDIYIPYIADGSGSALLATPARSA